MADFPAELHEFIDPSTKAGQPLSDEHVAAHVEIAEELAAVQAALGVNLASVGGGSLFVNVKDLGAAGDGTTDDTSPIQAAINSIPNGGCIYFPPGVYLVGTLTVGGATTLLGAGGHVSTLRLKPATNASLLQTYDDGQQRHGLTIRSLGFDGQADQQTSGMDPLINIRAMNEAIASDVYILEPRGPGIQFGQDTAGMHSTAPMLDRVVIRGDVLHSHSHGIALESGSSDALVSQCDVGYFGAGAGLLISGHNGATVSNTNAWQCRYGFHVYLSDRTRVVGCLADWSKWHGFIAQGSSNLQLDTCQAHEYGIAATDTYDGFRVEGTAEEIHVSNCRAWSTMGRVGIGLINDLSHVRVLGGSMNGQNVATSVVGANITDYRFLAVAGVTDVSGDT